MTTMVGKKADFYLASGTPVAFATEAMTDVSNVVLGQSVRTVYQISNSVKRYWDANTTLLVEISLNSGTSWAPVTPDAVQYAGGRIKFNASQQAAPAAQFRVTGAYIPWARVGGGHEWGANPAIGLYDATEFMANSKHHVSSQLGEGTITVARFWLDDTLRALLVAGARVAVILWLDASAQPAGPRWEAFTMLSAGAIKAVVAGVLTEDLTFELDSTLDFVAS